MPARIELQPGYILHTRAYRDTSLLVDVLTQDYGKICLVARGARKPKSHQRHLLQSFIPVLLSWQGNHSLKTLIGIELQTSSLLSLSGSRLYSALYANELLAYLLPQDDPVVAIYQNYQSLLSCLSDNTSNLEPSLRCFEFNLLDDLGYGINFYSDADSGNDLNENKNYFFIQDHGFVDTEGRPEIRDISFPGKNLLDIQKSNFSRDETKKIAKVISRMALKTHLRGRELKSRELFNSFVNKPAGE